MATVAETQAKVAKTVTNMDRFNAFVNTFGVAETDVGLVKTLPTLAAEAQIETDTATAAAVAAEASNLSAGLATATAQGFVAGLLYPTTAAGLAATAANGYFSVVGDGTSTYAILYQDVAGSAVEKARYASKAAYEGASGATLIGDRVAPSAQVVSVHSKLQYEVMLGKDYPATAAGLAAASAVAQRVIIPEDLGAASLGSSTVVLQPYTTIVGRGSDRSGLTSTAALAFVYESPDGADQAQSPAFHDLRITCAASGIRYNSAANGFTDLPDTQKSLIAPSFLRLDLRGPASTTAGAIGFEANKCFRMVIDQSEIREFQTGLLTRGCDFTRLRGGTRVWAADTLLDIRRAGDAGFNYGSGFMAHGCDFLGWKGTAVKSDDNDLKVLESYFETGAGFSGYVFDFSGIGMQRVNGNRIEVPSTFGKLMRVQQDCSLLSFDQNNTDGNPWGVIDWTADASGGALFWRSVINRQRIMGGGNITIGTSTMPFRTIDPEPLSTYREPWVMTAGTSGLMATDYGLLARVKAGRFIIPPRSDFSSQMSWKGAQTVTGNVNVRVLARGVTVGQPFQMQRLDGTTIADQQTMTLTTSDAWYTPFPNVPVTDLLLRTFNTTGGNVELSAIVVERV